MGMRIRQFLRALSPKQIVFSLITLLSLMLYAILTLWSGHMIGGLADQQAAARWDQEGGSA